MSESQRPVVMVSGGSRGIGRQICTDLAERGYAISYAYARERPESLQTLEQCQKAGVPATAFHCDVRDFEQCRQWVDAVRKKMGPVSHLVNCAGITRDAPLTSMSVEDWTDVIFTNLFGVFNMSKLLVFDFMKQRHGVIINMSSVSGVYGNATQTNYSASKAGVIGLTRALSREVGRYGIRVNAIAPGFIETDMTAALNDKVRAEMLKRIPLMRFGRVEDVSQMVCFLVSEESSYVTGQVLQVDGGITI